MQGKGLGPIQSQVLRTPYGCSVYDNDAAEKEKQNII